ncbi:MAG TPA: hypothetical protein VK148_15950 [Xanthobacteraceae bacterium]|jgi:hypothetical protein|nr:hypothetical protein [Xanthobacteraceae bacterium]
MKKFGLAAVTTLALASASYLALAGSSYAADMMLKSPAMEAAQPVSGYIELYSGWGNTTIKGDEGYRFGLDGWTLGGAARGTYWWSHNASLQLDVQGEGTSFSDGSQGRFSEHSFLIGGHASWRDSRYLWGVFGAAGDATTFSGPNFRHGVVGGEGQAYLGAVTLYGQIGYDTTVGSPLFGPVNGINAVFGRGTVRYYLAPNTRLEGTGLYAGGKVDLCCGIADENFHIWLARAKIEHKFAGSPFSVFAAYEWSETHFDGSRLENQKITAGVRLGINEGTLQSNDRKGTTLDIIDVLRLVGGGIAN